MAAADRRARSASGARSALDTPHQGGIAMNLGELLAAGTAMQIIHVLRDQIPQQARLSICTRA